ncbi:hypothetical protein LAZ67_7002943 [Cordylochernes scorpioides]|uniref:Uncharacterized protein n=1 Tax=Cordylochernes scorpioides TaxID=51811 RepID=A0ABY6KPE8_9ARAC|nr:hypothetical protein LAZ67_7002943 [Cordylochernes scorpioides]
MATDLGKPVFDKLRSSDEKLNSKDIDELVANLTGFILAGFDTVGITLSMMTWVLSNRQDIQDRMREEIVKVLGDRLVQKGTLHNYFENWSLRLNPAKSVHCCFHLNNHRAERKLKLFINNSQITHSEHPKYLGIHLDRTLTFKTHLTKLKGKLSSRNNILHKLAGSSWGSDANTLRTSALALIFSTAEYCAPVWEGSCHTKLIDTQLNSTLRIITGVCQPTRIDWLPVLAHISPPELRRKEATKKMYQKLLDSPDLEINPILQSPPKHRLKSRNPIWSRGNQLLSQNFNISEALTNSWISSDIPNKNLITSPSVKIPGFSLPRREWVLLNRFRTGQGRCAELMKLWGYTKDPNCACNVPQSMSHILDDCPLYKFNGGISNLHSVTPEALNWLKALPLRL